MITKKRISEKISCRDKFRVGKNYYTTLRGYQVRRDILDAMFNAIKMEYLPTDKKLLILDAGSGPGIVGDYVFKKIKKQHHITPLIIFADISEAMLKAVPQDFNYIAVKNDVTKLEFPDNFFNIVVMKQVLDYLPKNLQLRALNEIYRVLKTDGQFILSALISVDDKSNHLTNELYNKREKIIAKDIAIKKYIPTKNILIDWLAHTDFKGIKVQHVYDIPVSPLDFQQSFGLNKRQTLRLNKLYQKIIRKDKKNTFRSNIFKSKKFKGYIELIEKGMIVKFSK